MAEERTVIHSKRKNLQVLIDYCLDQKLSFSVSPRTIAIDEFEVGIEISSIRMAIALGMFAKENKYEVAGLGEMAKVKTAPVKKAEGKEVIAPVAEPAKAPAKEEGSLLSFDLNVNGN